MRNPPPVAVAQSGASLEGTPWRLVVLVGPDGVVQSVVPGTEITATFEAGRVTGSGGCNAYTGGYAVNGSAIMISGLAGTLRACTEPGVMEQEYAYLATLGTVGWFEVANDVLYLRDPAGSIVLIYVPQPQTTLEGTTWLARDYNNGRGAVVSVISGSAITAVFNAGELSGSAGCNSYSAPYAVNGNAIDIGPAATTRIFCGAPEGIMEQEAAYLTALQTASFYMIEGDQLILTRADGARVASYAAVSAGAAPTAAPVGLGKITFDLDLIDDAGLIGPPDGLVAVAYELCIPATSDYLAEVRSIDPSLRMQPGAPGRLGCGPAEVLSIGSTHQPNWRSVLHELAGLDYVVRIDRFFAE